VPLPIVQNARLLMEWSPLATMIRQFGAEPDPVKRAEIAGDAIEWLAAKTESRLDDELAKRLAAVLRTTEGVALVSWVADALDQMEPRK
jgi:hypothetical protein